MVRTKFIPTVLVIILGVNLGAWTLSVATSAPQAQMTMSVPVSAPALDAQSQAASVEVSQQALSNPLVAASSSTSSAASY